MKIAHLLPHSVTYPLKVHNARHEWALRLAMLQAHKGHDVTLYCNPSSCAPGVIIRGIDHATDNKAKNNEKLLTLALLEKHDIYHSHFDNAHYKLGHLTKNPIVYTQHWWPDQKTIELAASYGHGNIWAVPPTRYMYDYDMASGIKTYGHIYHGIDTNFFTPSTINKSGRLLSVSRISPEKNVEQSVEIAKKSGLGLDIIGKIADKNQQYWEKLSQFIDGSQIIYHGTKNQNMLIEYYSSAQALLFPSYAEEAFGLVAIEAQACGTPVIMWNRGSRSELVEEEKTGFLCNDMNDFTHAARLSQNLSATNCRNFALRFDIHTMAANYERLYAQLLINHRS